MSDDEDFDDEGDMIILLEPFDLLWSDLNHEQQVAAGLLGLADEEAWKQRYSQTWPDWEDLSGEQQEALEDNFELEADTWPPEQPEVDILDMPWSDLTPEQQQGALLLGFAAADWPVAPGKVWAEDFSDLSAAEEEAAAALGFDEWSWPPQTAGAPLEFVFQDLERECEAIDGTAASAELVESLRAVISREEAEEGMAGEYSFRALALIVRSSCVAVAGNEGSQCHAALLDYETLIGMPIRCRSIGSNLIEEVLPGVLGALSRLPLSDRAPDVRQVFSTTFCSFQRTGVAWLANACISLLRSCYLIGAVEFCVESMAPLRKELARHKKTAPWLASTEQHFYALELDVRCDQEGMGAGEQAESGASAVSSEVSDQLMHIFEQAESAYELNISTIANLPRAALLIDPVFQFELLVSAAHKQSLRGNHRRATQHYAAVLELESESSRYGMARDAGIASASLWLAQNVGDTVSISDALETLVRINLATRKWGLRVATDSAEYRSLLDSLKSIIFKADQVAQVAEKAIICLGTLARISGDNGKASEALRLSVRRAWLKEIPGPLPTPDGHLTIDRGCILHDSANQVELMTSRDGGLSNLRKHIKVNYRNEAGEDAGGDFSLAMANGRAVARCDFRMVHRALRDEPVPYVCRRDYQLRNKDGRPQRSWLRRGQVFQVYETCAEKGNVQLRMSDDDDLWVCGRARAYNGVQFSVAETKTSEIIAEPDLLVRKGEVIIITHGSRDKPLPDARSQHARERREEALAKAVAQEVHDQAMSAELEAVQAEIRRHAPEFTEPEAEAGPADNLESAALAASLQELYTDSEKIDFALLSVEELDAQMKVCSGCVLLPHLQLSYTEPTKGCVVSKRGEFHREYVDIYPGLFHLTAEGSVTPTAKEVWEFSSRASIFLAGHEFTGAGALFGPRTCDLSQQIAVPFQMGDAALRGNVAIVQRAFADDTGFVEKSRRCQSAGAVAVVFINAKMDPGLALPTEEKDDGEDINIPVVCVEAYVCSIFHACRLSRRAAGAVVPKDASPVAVAICLTSAISTNCGANYVCHPLYSLYKDCGRICGMALFHGMLLGLPLSTTFIRMLQDDEPRLLADLMQELRAEDADSLLANSFLSEIDADRAAYYETIGTEFVERPFTRTVSQIPGLGEIPLSAGSQTKFVSNPKERDEYFRIALQSKLVESIRWQAAAFRTGVLGVVPKCVISLFTSTELKEVWGGASLGAPQLMDWKANTVYEFGLTEESVEVLWFWDILGSETEKFRAAVLKFATGTARAPVDGFANLRKGEKNGAIQRFTLFGNGTELAGAVNMRDDADLMRRAALESVQSGMGAGGTTFRAQTCINTLRLPPSSNFRDREHYRSMLALSCQHVQIDST